MATDWAHDKWAEPDDRMQAIRKYAATHLTKEFCSGKDVYQFGVWCGHSMVCIEKLWARYGLPIRRLYGLDSFQGLPKETAERLFDPAWWEGNFSAVRDFEVNSVEEAMAAIRRRLPASLDVQPIPGFWDKVLTDELVRSADMRPASYVDIDCDIYTSAVQALDFLLRNKLVVPGTYIGYHDWGSAPGGGEQRAHAEMSAGYGMMSEMVFNNRDNVVFLVKGF